ncbi:MAG: class I SAM-dependent methyltransferase [Janthinobacterium lividum]
MVSTFNARDAAAYERSMGRWSRRLAPGFIAFAGLDGMRSVLDVGCGTGSLLFELAANPAFDRLEGLDASEIYVRAARDRSADTRIGIQHGDACAMPFDDAAFDAALSQLVLQFIPDPAAAVAEMCRVVRPGGIVAAAVWNSGGGMPHQRMFWDTAAMLDPAAVALRGQTFNRPMTRRGNLHSLFEQTGLEDVSESSATIWMDFDGFDDFWGPIASGEGTLGKYVTSLPGEAAYCLQRHLQAAYEAGQPDGPRPFACTAHVCRGMVPTVPGA